jgi:hypothetical protein
MNAISLRTMGIRSNPINLFFLLVLGALFLAPPISRAADSAPAGTNSPPKKNSKPKKASDRLAVIRLHMEVTDDGGSPRAEVIRSAPQSFPISKDPFFDERDLIMAQMVETPDGGFIIQLEGTEHGRNAVEMATAASNGRHILVYGQWTDDDDVTESRWLAAPVIRGALRNGTIRFSVDADLTEARQLVDGLNNVAIKLKNQIKSKGGPPTSSGKKPPVNTGSAASDAINKATRP